MLHLPADDRRADLRGALGGRRLDDLSVQVTAGSDDSTCTLVVTLPGAVPGHRDLDGAAAGRDDAGRDRERNRPADVFVGTAAAASGKIDTLTLTSPLRCRTGAGVAGQRRRPGADHHRDGGARRDVGGGRAADRVDHRGQRRATAGLRHRVRPPRPAPVPTCGHGSLLVGCRRPQRRRRDATRQRPNRSGATPSCRWFASPPGTTMDFNGTRPAPGCWPTPRCG